MSAPEIKLLALDVIEVGTRLRGVDDEAVVRIQTSMAERGLINPISVRLTSTGKYRLIAGAHRLQAAKNLNEKGVEGWNSIPAIVEKCSPEEAELREIDENLHRAELTPYDQAEFLAQRWVVWNRLHGSGHGGDRKSSSRFFELAKSSRKPGFFEATAAKFGVDETTIRLAVKRRLKTSDEVWVRIKGTDAAKKGVLLDQLQKATNPAEILDLAETKFGGKIALALNAKELKPRAVPSVARLLKAIDAALEQWSDVQRREFFKEMRGRK